MAEDGKRYPASMRWLHWLMAALILLAYLAIEQRGLFPRGSSGRSAMVQSHFWLGLGVFVLAFWRLAARLRGSVPPVTPPLPRWQAMSAAVLHLALYAFFIAMPLLGLATAWADGKEVFLPFTGIALPSLLGENEPLAHDLEDLHGGIGEFFYWVIGLHIAAALYHHFVRKDDSLRRMR